MTNYDNIPKELVQRDQWLFWNSSRETPRAPLDSPAARYSCSWSEPATWLSFYEVAEATEAVETAGIGYVNAVDNDAYDEGQYGLLDLDGVLDENGRPADWLPSLQPFFDRDAYTEYSPSDEGIHIPVKGLDEPEWWTDQHFSEDEHRGVEVLTHKFSTFTGNKLRGAGDTVVESGEWLTEWLAEAYKAVAGEDPRVSENQTLDDSAGNQPATREEWLTEEVAEEALDCINPDVSYPTWRDIGMALANHFGRATGRRLFKNWSRRGAKWDADAKEQAERIISDARSYNFDAGTIVYYAQQHGFNASEYARAAADAGDGDEEEGVNKEAVADAGGQASTQSDESLDLSPVEVCEQAVNDKLTPAGYVDEEGDEYDFYLRDLHTNELAHYVWRLAEKTGNDDLLARANGPVLAYQPNRSIWIEDDKRRLREIGRQALGSAFSSRVTSELEEEIRADPERVVEPNEMGAPDETIMTRSGLLHLRDREVEPGKREHCAVANIRHEIDADADCPRWREFIEESIETEAERLKFQEYAGYCLWRHEQRFGKALMLVGPTDSGKSTALTVLREILGKENVASESLKSLVDSRWGRAQLVGNLANIREEVTPSGIQGVEMFKELTGGETQISAEFKGQQKFQFTVTQKMVFATNQMPSVEDADEAFYNRLLFVRFPNTVPPDEQDPALGEKLIAEAPGIINWMLDGLDRLLEQEGFTSERLINEKKELCDAFGGVLDRFTYHCLMVTGEEDDIVSKSDLHDLAQRYAEDIDKEPGWSKQQGFTQKLGQERGIGQTTRRIEGEVTGVFTGVRVKPEIPHQYGMELRAKCADTDPDPETLDGYGTDEARPGYDIRKEKEVIPMLMTTLRKHDGLTRGELLRRTTDEAGIDEGTAEAKIEKAKRRGDIYEPKEGVYRCS